jgi:hypothetical protein
MIVMFTDSHSEITKKHNIEFKKPVAFHPKLKRIGGDTYFPNNIMQALTVITN